MNDAVQIGYDVLMVGLSISLLVLSILLFLFCKKKPIQFEETVLQSVKRYACSYPLMNIHAATDGFHRRRILGTGRLGIVYAGILENGELVAVKRIHHQLVLSNAGFGFSSILKWLSLAQHPHIVPLLGFSEGPGERIIVMELVNTVNLNSYLYQNPDGDSLLDWCQRFRIAAGVARGLEYLHEVMAPNVVHGFVKASNILIDINFRARLCDYGLNFLAPQEKRHLLGYVDEEYWSESQGGASKESDVYGLGVVLLQLLSGRECEEGLIVKWALSLIKEMRFGELLDPRLIIPNNMKPFVRLAKVASSCVGNSRKCRPTIGQVAAILNNLEMAASSFDF